MTVSASSTIHPTAIIDPLASIGPGVNIGPRCTIDGPVVLGEGVRLIGDVRIQGPATIGPRTVIYPYACLGYEPQDRKFSAGSVTGGIAVGADCVIRESFTIHASTSPERITRLGDRVMAMVNSHVGHDAQIGNDVTLVNNALVAGHARVADLVTMSGATAIHQFASIGRLAFISGGTVCTLDVPPFCIAALRNRINGINRIGMRRAGMARDEISAVTNAFRLALAPPMTRGDMLDILDRLGETSPAVTLMAEFVRESKRGVCGGPGRPTRGHSSAHRFGREDHGEQTDALHTDPADQLY